MTEQRNVLRCDSQELVGVSPCLEQGWRRLSGGSVLPFGSEAQAGCAARPGAGPVPDREKSYSSFPVGSLALLSGVEGSQGCAGERRNS